MALHRTKLNPYRAFIQLISIYMFTTLSYTLWPISSPNRIIGFFIFIDVILMTILVNNKHQVSILASTVLFSLVSFIFAKDYSRNLTDAIYWVTTMLIFAAIVKGGNTKKILEQMDKSKSLITAMVCICDILLVVGLLNRNCYKVSWGGVLL